VGCEIECWLGWYAMEEISCEITRLQKRKRKNLSQREKEAFWVANRLPPSGTTVSLSRCYVGGWYKVCCVPAGVVEGEHTRPEKLVVDLKRFRRRRTRTIWWKEKVL
jgi:hypothetical protein